MDRQQGARRPGRPRDPHARGDGPVDARARKYLSARSPRAWGWTGHRRLRTDRLAEIPTRVGMDRRSRCLASQRRRDPHARGDGPVRDGRARCASARSPRAWGWTVVPFLRHRQQFEIPTRVGMDRRPPRRDGTRDGDPHARGDGPQVTSKKFGTSSRSPRAWGWTVPGGPAERLAGEIPTRVGMDRRSRWCRSGSRRDPHARGDGPIEGQGPLPQNARSPRAWGWTGRPPERRRGAQEIPTRVGMDRWSPRPRPTPT